MLRLRRENCEEAYYFLHIPKTAGTSLTAILDAQFSEADRCPASLWSQLIQIPCERWSEYSYFRGHFYAYLDRFVEQRLKTIVFLRDPIERSLSHYFHICRDPNHYAHGLSAFYDDLGRFLDDPRTAPLIANFQTRALGWDLDPFAIAATLTEDELEQFKLEEILETANCWNLSEHELLDRAKSKIDHCFFVGITESFDQSLSLLARQLGFGEFASRSLNRGENRTSSKLLPREIADKLEALLQLDLELYRYASLRLKSELAPKRHYRVA